MKKTKDQLKAVSKSLLSLTKQVDRITKQVAKMEAAKKPVAKKAKKQIKKTKKAVARKRPGAKGKTVLDNVLDIIKKSKKGVTIPIMRAKTKLDARQLSNALYKLTKKNMIKTALRGVYVKK